MTFDYKKKYTRSWGNHRWKVEVFLKHHSFHSNFIGRIIYLPQEKEYGFVTEDLTDPEIRINPMGHRYNTVRIPKYVQNTCKKFMKDLRNVR